MWASRHPTPLLNNQQLIATERHQSNTPRGSATQAAALSGSKGPGDKRPVHTVAQVVHCIQPRQAVQEDAASLSKIKTLIVHHSSRNGNEAKQPYHVITNPGIRTEGDSVIPDMTCKQGPHVRTRPQASETIRKNRSHHHQPNFRETHSGQKSGVLHQLIP